MASRESSQLEQDACRPPPEGPILCANNCGFFGTAENNHLCSCCYREAVRKAAAATEASSSSELRVPVVTVSEQDSIPSASSSGTPPPQKPNRCRSCRKRVGLTGFKCRCGDVFCSLHRYSDKHECPFDYKTVARDAIARANPVVKADKLDKI